jgi:hypothetical protein
MSPVLLSTLSHIFKCFDQERVIRAGEQFDQEDGSPIPRTNIRAVLILLTEEESEPIDKLFAVILLSGGESLRPR